MNLFHRHDWVTTGSSFSPPPPNLTRVRGFAPDDKHGRDWSLSMIYGVTVATQKCAGCGEITFRTTPGRADYAEGSQS